MSFYNLSGTTPFQINDEPRKWNHPVIQKIRNSPTIWFPCATGRT
uniref:Uncharacterized protein n=1 Tax=viral metagenome TaxID=1070528 RepID=A0A6C0AE14_9ZZZZ